MTTSIWTGPGGTRTQPRSGFFEDPSNWYGNHSPAKDNDVIFAPGKYTVSLSSSNYELGALTVGAGVTVDSLDSSPDFGALTVTKDSTNFGTLHTTGAWISIGSGAVLYNFGQVYGQSDSSFLGQTQGAGTLDNLGVIHTTPGSLFALGSVTFNESEGVIDTRGGGQLSIVGPLTNQGLVSAVDGGFINFKAAGLVGSTTNLADGVLTGGQWSAIGDQSALYFLGDSAVSVLAAGTQMTLSGGSSIATQLSSGTVFLEDSLTQVGDDAALRILGGREFASSQYLDVYGLLQLGGGVLSSNGMIVHDDATSALVGYGDVASDIDMYGVLSAAKTKTGESLRLIGHNTIYAEGSLVGRGVLEIGGGTDVLQDGAHVLVKNLLISGGELDLQEDLVYGGKFRMTGGAVDLGGHILRLTGQVDLAGPAIALADGKLQLEGGDLTLHSGEAQITADLRNNGVVHVDGGHLMQLGAVNGVGAIHIAAGAVGEFGTSVGAGQTVSLDGAGAILALENPMGFKGAVAEFGLGDKIDLLPFAYGIASVGWKSDAGGGGGSLTVTTGAQSASIHLDGDYRRSQFHLGDDGHGGIAVTYGDASAALHAEAGWDAHGGLAI